jgi:hypothetical protein
MVIGFKGACLDSVAKVQRYVKPQKWKIDAADT